MDQNRRTKIVIASILLHLLLFFLWEGANFLNLFKDNPVPERIEPEPIVFQFVESEKPKRVIETVENPSKRKPKKANLLSDKDSIARNRKADPKLKTGEAYSKGDYQSYEIPEPPTVISPPPAPSATEKTENKRDLSKYFKDRSHRELIKKATEQQAIPPLPQSLGRNRNQLLHDNPLSRSLDMGGLSFNTYNWDFAPYLLLLKSKIQSNIFPPMAFTHLGLINGTTLLKFRIYPSGKMTGLYVIRYKGHKALMETSFNAVRISAPFPELPEDFPEEYLEITGKFIYMIQGQTE